MEKVKVSYIQERTGLTRQAINWHVRRNTIPSPVSKQLGRGGSEFCKREIDMWIAAYNILKKK